MEEPRWRDGRFSSESAARDLHDGRQHQVLLPDLGVRYAPAPPPSDPNGTFESWACSLVVSLTSPVTAGHPHRICSYRSTVLLGGGRSAQCIVGYMNSESALALCTWNRQRTRLNFQDALSALTSNCFFQVHRLRKETQSWCRVASFPVFF